MVGKRLIFLSLEYVWVNRTFLSGYLKALENQGYIKSKKIGPAKVYFNTDLRTRGKEEKVFKDLIGEKY